MNADKQNRERRLGSAADFDREWRQALSQDGGRGLIYPSAEPKTQFELFERVKAETIDAVLDEYQISQGLVLEYGCGAAGMSIYVVNKGFRAIACDISLNALRLASLNMARHSVGNSPGQLSMTLGNVLRLPFADGVFDIVMSYGLLEHFAPELVDSVLAEVMRTLRPGGLFIADIAHGRFSARTVGTWMSLAASLVFHTVTLRWRKLPHLAGAYLNGLYENDLDDRMWSSACRRAGLHHVELRICHPFPPLAVSGRLERMYVTLMQRLRGVWRWFNRTQPLWARWWGWLYLVWGIK